MSSGYRNLLATLLVLSLLAVCAPARAHQQWLMPNFFSADDTKAWLSFDHTFGDHRFHAGSAPGLYYQWWVVSPNRQKRSVPSLFAGKTKIVGEVELTEPGTYRLEGEEPNMIWTKIKIDGADTWQPGPRSNFAGQEIVESKIYFAKALAYVTLGAPSSLPQEMTGDLLEIVFQQHPNSLEAGRGFEVELMSSGKPVKAHELQLFADRSSGHDPTITCTTDAKGSCKIVPKTAGRYLLQASLQGPTPDDASTDGFSYRVTVALEVGKGSSAGKASQE